MMLDLPIKVMVAGGTIAMHPTEHGLAVDPHFATRLAQTLHSLAPTKRFEIEMLQPALDSASATPQTWLQLATWVKQQRDHASGFLILHGTDTMAYSAAALSLLLQGLGKAVVLTGSQLPLVFENSDAAANVALALDYLHAPQSALGGVVLSFGGLLLDGAAVRKIHSRLPLAFQSPNRAPLGGENVPSALGGENVPSALGEVAPFLGGQAVDFEAQSVAMLYVTPDMPQSALAALADERVLGVVVQSYGMGNLPNSTALQSALVAARARGVVVINTTQCLGGGVSQSTYAAGAGRWGLISGGAQTPEFLYALLHVGIGYGLRGDALAAFVGQYLS